MRLEPLYQQEREQAKLEGRLEGEQSLVRDFQIKKYPLSLWNGHLARSN
jgi:hypothetical protein